MSKSKGNTIDPFAVVAEHGADVVRWYMMSNSPPWDNMKFAMRGLLETRNKFFSTVENVYRFFASYANIDGFDGSETRLPVGQRKELDRWILSRLNATVATADQAYAPIHGAHPHQHAIRKRLLDPLSLEILDGRFFDGDHISAQLNDAKVTFSKYLTEISKLQEKGGTISWTFGK
jgi:isoleucyl-tRNA synthetase